MEPSLHHLDVAVIGAGHAGAEAALAAARLGVRTILFTINLDGIANLPCNPSIGGTAKGHLVREIDALGGEMGRVADATTLQSRMLNRGKGPAVHSLRAQVDRRLYSHEMKIRLEHTPGLLIKQAEIITLAPAGAGWRLSTHLGAEYEVGAIVIATGTYLGGRIHIGHQNFESGPDGTFAATRLTQSLLSLGLPLRRFKTGTPPRVHRSSIDFSQLAAQPGEEPVTPFSFSTLIPPENKVDCHITYTTEETRRIILENLQESAMYSGHIEGVGPRYCPSIEDKIVRFADKPRHQVFIEPCGLDTEEMYLQGVSTSMPEPVQELMYRTLPGLERLEIMRSAYAIEYDCIDPLALRPTLEVIDHPGLFGAGQFNGSSGYEEAAAQGLVAGINAAHHILGRESFVLPRSSSYIGTLIDDLVTKGCSDPYRMMTSRSEYRLLLRQDNADARLMPLGRALGLVREADYCAFESRQAAIAAELARIERVNLPPSAELNALIVSRETSPVTTGVHLTELIRRPQLNYACLAKFDPERPLLDARITEQVEIHIKYEGYIRRQQAQIDQAARLESRLLPADMLYDEIRGLRLEAAEKLGRLRPHSIGQASRISGVTPADISVLLIWLEKKGRTTDD